MTKQLNEFEMAFDKDHIGDDDLRYIPLVPEYEWIKADKFESAKWAASWAFNRAKEIAKKSDYGAFSQFIVDDIEAEQKRLGL